MIGKTHGTSNFAELAHDRDVRDPGEETHITRAVSRAPSFFVLHTSVREIGVFMYRICLRIIIVGFILVLWYILADLTNLGGRVSITTTVVSPSILLIASLLFIVPQMNIHGLLTRFKDRTITELEAAHDEVRSAFLASMGDPKFFEKEKRWKTRQEIREDSSTIKDMISEARAKGTWSFSFPAVLKLFGAAALPLLTVLMQAIASGAMQDLLGGAI
nr:hypothetical protein [Candidatus Njordarchaeum guaymaensis]